MKSYIRYALTLLTTFTLVSPCVAGHFQSDSKRFSNLVSPCVAGHFQSDSKRFSNSKMDIVITEVDRNARTSVLEIKVNTVGSSVGSSFFIVCSLSDLAKQRGGFRYIVKIEEKPKRGQMLVGFLNSADEPPETVNSQFAGARVIDLEQFAPICDNMK